MYERPSNRLSIHKGFTFGPDPYELKRMEGREVVDTIILADSIAEISKQQDQEILLAIRLLTPANRKLKYCTRVVLALISSDATKYPERLHVRYQRGLLHPEPWSIKIIEERPGLLTVDATSSQART